MAQFNNLFGDDRDIVYETGATAGQLLRVSSTNPAELEAFDLVSGIGTSENVITTTLTTSTVAYVVNSFDNPNGTEVTGTNSATAQFTSTGVDLTGVFDVGDLIQFSGEFTGANVTFWGAGTYRFWFPIASIVAPTAGTETTAAWTITLNLNEDPFVAWNDDTTTNLVNFSNSLTTPAGIPTSNITETFLGSTDDPAGAGLDISLATTVSTESIAIQQYADGDLEIAGINAQGVVIPLTEGDFGTAGQNVVVGTDGTSLTFANPTNPTSGTIPINDGGTFDDSPIRLFASGEGNGVEIIVDNRLVTANTTPVADAASGNNSATFLLQRDSDNVTTKSTAVNTWIPTAGTVPASWDDVGLTNNATQNNIPIWDGDSFEDSAITQGLIDIFNNNTISNIQTFVDGLSVIFTKTNAATESGNSINNGNIVKFSTGLQGGFNGFSSTSLPFLDNAIGTVSNVSGQIITVSFSTALAGAFDFNDTLDGGGNTLVINENNVSPVFVDGDLSITGNITGNVTGNVTGDVTGGIDVDEAGTGSAAGTYEFRIADSGNTGAAGFITFVRE